jgi:hypothetical protein
VVHALDVTGDVAAQGEHAFAAECFDAFGALPCRIKSAVFHGEFDELGFKAGGGEDFVDADEELTLLAVFFRTDDVRKGWTKEGLIGIRVSLARKRLIFSNLNDNNSIKVLTV